MPHNPRWMVLICLGRGGAKYYLSRSDPINSELVFGVEWRLSPDCFRTSSTALLATYPVGPRGRQRSVAVCRVE